MSLNHEIRFTNVKSEEIISYPLIILKGIIINKHLTSCEDNKIYINHGNSFKVTNGQFKALIELNVNENLIIINYCCYQSDILIKYLPRKTHYSILPLYIICNEHDGLFQAPASEDNTAESAIQRITLGVKLLQSVIAEKLYEENHERKTFQLEDNCRIFYSRLDCNTARKMNQNQLWSCIARELIDSNFEHERIKFLGFLSCTKYSGEKYKESFKHDDIVNITEAYVALGGGGLALFSSACLYTWPSSLSEVISRFENNTSVDKTKFMDDSCYRSTWGGCFSTTLGSVLHELCHTFDLGHTQNGVMGRGFDDIHKVFILETNGSLEQSKENSRLKQIVQRKNECFQKNTNSYEDGIFWTKSCTTILAYHRWMNDFKCSENNIKFDSARKFISSISGLRVVEVREEDTSMVLLNWTFEGKILKFFFQLPVNELKKRSQNYILFIEDNIGNTLKETINI